jgi:hypothetical protein
MLYTGMQQLDRVMDADIHLQRNKWVADHFPEKMLQLNGAVNNKLGECYANLDGDGKMDDILYQNSLGDFCRYWHKTTGEAPVCSRFYNGEINPLTYLLQYYRCLRMLSSNVQSISHEELPYIYEEVCRLICGFTGAEMCYIAYSSNGNYPEVFAQSGYYVKFLQQGRILAQEKMEAILYRARKVWDENSSPKRVDEKYGDSQLIPSIALLQDDKEDDMVLMIPLKNDDAENKAFYIVLQADVQKSFLGCRRKTNERWQYAIRKARDVLFMRHNLQAVLSRDYTTLINFRFDCSYVRPICEENHESPSIMHISDLHIREDLHIDWVKKTEKAIENNKELNQANMKIDILAITGDIVDGRGANAPTMERNYEIATRVLNVLVCHLWKDKDGYLPHDWKRRVIITTGNHDYAAMNQFQVMQKRRALTIGTPVEKDGGTMSKFTYLIEFLVRYLDVPINELLRNDLNEIRNYHVLNLKVISLNCSGIATTRRTNKMGVNKSVVRSLLNRNAWTDNRRIRQYQKGEGENNDDKVMVRTPFRLCLAHYAHTQELSYVIDNYSVLPGWEWGTGTKSSCVINMLELAFEESVIADFVKQGPGMKHDASLAEKENEEMENRHKAFLEQMNALEDTLNAMMYGEEMGGTKSADFAKVLREYADRTHKTEAEVVVEMRTSDLYQQMETYHQWLTEKPQNRNDEFVSELIHNVAECVQMSADDIDSYKEVIDEIKKNGGLDLLLAGHIHANVEDKNENVLIAGKFFDDDGSSINGYVINKMRKNYYLSDTTFINEVEPKALHYI